jgi:hypothetical protein
MAPVARPAIRRLMMFDLPRVGSTTHGHVGLYLADRLRREAAETGSTSLFRLAGPHCITCLPLTTLSDEDLKPYSCLE